MLRKSPHTKSFTSVAPHSATGWKIWEEVQRTEVAPRTRDACKKLSYRLTPQPNQKKLPPHSNTLRLSSKNDPQTGTECPRTSTRRCWPARRNERTNEPTNERLELNRRDENRTAGQRERESAQSCGRLNKAMSTQVTRTQQSETTSE